MLARVCPTHERGPSEKGNQRFGQFTASVAACVSECFPTSTHESSADCSESEPSLSGLWHAVFWILLLEDCGASDDALSWGVDFK